MGSTAGPIGDAPTAFESQVLAAAKALATQLPGDPRVLAAVQLGWVMGSLMTRGAQTPLPSGFPITEATVYKAKALELDTLLARLKVGVTPGPDALKTRLTEGVAPGGNVPLATAIAIAADAWEPSLVAAMLGADVHLAKAYGVGQALNLLAYGPRIAPDAGAETPAAGAPTTTRFQAEKVTGIADALDDLTTVLPAHAGRGVANSIRAWQAATSPPDGDTLRAQCELWRIVLTGEKKATELLEPENYLDAAEKLAVKLRATAAVLLRQYLPWVLLIIALLIGAAFVLLSGQSTGSRAVAGVSSVLVALGLTWKGVGTSLGKLAAQLDAPLWGAELDEAVTEAITLGVPMRKQKWLITRRFTTKGGDYANRTERRPGIDPAAKPR